MASHENVVPSERFMTEQRARSSTPQSNRIQVAQRKQGGLGEQGGPCAVRASGPPIAACSSAILAGRMGDSSAPAMRTASRDWYRIAASSAALEGSLAS